MELGGTSEGERVIEELSGRFRCLKLPIDMGYDQIEGAYGQLSSFAGRLLISPRKVIAGALDKSRGASRLCNQNLDKSLDALLGKQPCTKIVVLQFFRQSRARCELDQFGFDEVFQAALAGQVFAFHRSVASTPLCKSILKQRASGQEQPTSKGLAKCDNTEDHIKPRLPNCGDKSLSRHCDYRLHYFNFDRHAACFFSMLS